MEGSTYLSLKTSSIALKEPLNMTTQSVILLVVALFLNCRVSSLFSLILQYKEGVDMLREAGIEMGYDEDLR